jgi:glycosyltransferase involved in cell wall biosynthesis
MAPKVTILQIVPSLEVGGAERTTIDITRALTKAGCQALIASEGGRMEEQLAEAGGELIMLPVAAKNLFTIYANASKLAAIIRERKVSLVHARSRAPAWSALKATKQTGVPFVTTYHGFYEAKGPLKRFKRLYNSVMVRSDATIANSQWTADHIRKTYGTDVNRVVVIPRGLDLKYFNPGNVAPNRLARQRERWHLSPGERIVLLPGRLTRWKGQLVLIEALGLLDKSGRWPAGVRAVLAGHAQGREHYVRDILNAIGTHELDRIAIVSEHVGDMAAAYLAADIVVSASTDPEAFGRVPPEAAAMGRPVIATDHGGARETVLAGQSGLLIKPDDAPALADALADLLARTPEELAAMGAKGRAHVNEHYSVERMCADTLALYQELIEVKVRRR